MDNPDFTKETGVELDEGARLGGRAYYLCDPERQRHAVRSGP